jgi:hypothetical protein
MKAYYFKEIANHPFIVNGAAAPFQLYPGNRGLLELTSPKDDMLIKALDEAAKNHRGGIIRLSEAQFLEKKSQLTSSPLPMQRQREKLRVVPRGPLARSKPKDMVAAGAEPVAKPAPIPLTRAAQKAIKPGEAPVVEGFRPATRRIKRAEAPAAQATVPQ